MVAPCRNALTVTPRSVRTAVRRDARVVAVAGSIVTVALPAASDTSTRSDAVLGFGQLVLTLTAVPTISGVLFEQDGKRLQVPRADGSLTTAPLARIDYRDLIDPA
jgi:spore germination protein GerM